MRCPKCGYISFDHLKECRKCNKNIEAISVGLFGSTYNIQAPTFLRLDNEPRDDQSEEMELSDERSFDVDDEYVDEELAVLVEDEDSDEGGEINFTEDAPAAIPRANEDGQDDGEIEIDFSQFEEADDRIDYKTDEAQPKQKKRDNVKIDVPPALSDISDLAPPAKNSDKKAESSGTPASPDFSDLDLEDLNFDLGLDGLDDAPKKSQAVPEKDVLSLDELDFADALAENNPAPAKKTEDLDLDLDLDFDLDLGGLSIHKDA